MGTFSEHRRSFRTVLQLPVQWQRKKPKQHKESITSVFSTPVVCVCVCVCVCDVSIQIHTARVT